MHSLFSINSPSAGTLHRDAATTSLSSITYSNTDTNNNSKRSRKKRRRKKTKNRTKIMSKYWEIRSKSGHTFASAMASRKRAAEAAEDVSERQKAALDSFCSATGTDRAFAHSFLEV